MSRIPSTTNISQTIPPRQEAPFVEIQVPGTAGGLIGGVGEGLLSVGDAMQRAGARMIDADRAKYHANAVVHIKRAVDEAEQQARQQDPIASVEHFQANMGQFRKNLLDGVDDPVLADRIEQSFDMIAISTESNVRSDAIRRQGAQLNDSINAALVPLFEGYANLSSNEVQRKNYLSEAQRVISSGVGLLTTNEQAAIQMDKFRTEGNRLYLQRMSDHISRDLFSAADFGEMSKILDGIGPLAEEAKMDPKEVKESIVANAAKELAESGAVGKLGDLIEAAGDSIPENMRQRWIRSANTHYQQILNENERKVVDTVADMMANKMSPSEILTYVRSEADQGNISPSTHARVFNTLRIQEFNDAINRGEFDSEESLMEHLKKSMSPDMFGALTIDQTEAIRQNYRAMAVQVDLYKLTDSALSNKIPLNMVGGIPDPQGAVDTHANKRGYLDAAVKTLQGLPPELKVKADELLSGYQDGRVEKEAVISAAVGSNPGGFMSNLYDIYGGSGYFPKQIVQQLWGVGGMNSSKPRDVVNALAALTALRDHDGDAFRRIHSSDQEAMVGYLGSIYQLGRDEEVIRLRDDALKSIQNAKSKPIPGLEQETDKQAIRLFTEHYGINLDTTGIKNKPDGLIDSTAIGDSVTSEVLAKFRDVYSMERNRMPDAPADYIYEKTIGILERGGVGKTMVGGRGNPVVTTLPIERVYAGGDEEAAASIRRQLAEDVLNEVRAAGGFEALGLKINESDFVIPGMRSIVPWGVVTLVSDESYDPSFVENHVRVTPNTGLLVNGKPAYVVTVFDKEGNSQVINAAWTGDLSKTDYGRKMLELQKEREEEARQTAEKARRREEFEKKYPPTHPSRLPFYYTLPN